MKRVPPQCWDLAHWPLSIMVWSAALIMRKFGVGEDTAGIVVAITGGLAVPGVLMGGTFADKYQAAHPAGRMRFAALADIASAAGIVLCIITAFLIHPDGSTEVSLWMILGFVFFSVYAIGAIAGQPAVGAVTQDVVPSELKGLSYGLAMFLMYVLGGGWSPWFTGMLSDHFGGGVKGLACAMIISGAAGFLAFACWWMASRHYAEDLERAREAALGRS